MGWVIYTSRLALLKVVMLVSVLMMDGVDYHYRRPRQAFATAVTCGRINSIIRPEMCPLNSSSRAPSEVDGMDKASGSFYLWSRLSFACRFLPVRHSCKVVSSDRPVKVLVDIVDGESVVEQNDDAYDEHG